MYAGHAALALLAKRARPRIPIALLVPVAFAPDWIEWIAMFWRDEARMLSHGLVSVGAGALLAGLVYWVGSRDLGDAVAVWATYWSHWFADLVTGSKPTWAGGPNVGLGLYTHPVADIVVESLLIVVCYWLLDRSLRLGRNKRRLGLLIPAGLIGLQIGFALIQRPEIKDPIKQIITLSGPDAGLSGAP